MPAQVLGEKKVFLRGKKKIVIISRPPPRKVLSCCPLNSAPPLPCVYQERLRVSPPPPPPPTYSAVTFSTCLCLPLCLPTSTSTTGTDPLLLLSTPSRLIQLGGCSSSTLETSPRVIHSLAIGPAFSKHPGWLPEGSPETAKYGCLLRSFASLDVGVVRFHTHTSTNLDAHTQHTAPYISHNTGLFIYLFIIYYFFYTSHHPHPRPSPLSLSAQQKHRKVYEGARERRIPL